MLETDLKVKNGGVKMKEGIKTIVKGTLLFVAIFLVFTVIPETDSRYTELSPYTTYQIADKLTSMQADVTGLRDALFQIEEEDVSDRLPIFELNFNQMMATVLGVESFFTTETWQPFEQAVEQAIEAFGQTELDVILNALDRVVEISYGLEVNEIEQEVETEVDDSIYEPDELEPEIDESDVDGSGEEEIDTEDKEILENGIRGVVWLDEDGDGQRNDDEPLLVGVTVRLYDVENDILVETAVTDEDGVFEFEELLGSYVVRVESEDNEVVFDAYDIDEEIGAYVPVISDNGEFVDFSDYEGTVPLYVGISPFTIWSGNLANWAALRTQVNTGGRTVINVSNTNNIMIPTGGGWGTGANNSGYHIYIPSGRNVTIRGTGATPVTFTHQTGSASWNRRHFVVAAGATLTLENVILDGGLTVHTPGTAYRGGISVFQGGSVILGEGAEIRNSQAATGGAIQAWGAGGSIVLNEGSAIRNNHAHASGGGISIYGVGRILTINGGEITGNTAEHGGGIRILHSANAVMNDGLISGNITRAPIVAGRGAGVHVSYHATFNMHGGEISDNHALGVNAAGAGVFIGFPTGPHANSATFNMHGGLIDGNTATYGAGLDVGINGRANLHEGVISNNTARRDGGGMLIYLQATNPANPPSMSVSVHEGFEIIDNAAGFNVINGERIETVASANGSRRGDGGGIHLSDSGILHLHGGEISRNEATGNGGGINIFEYAGSLIPGTINIMGTGNLWIEDNEARNGGGINWTNGELNIVGNTGDVYINRNQATYDGGGLRVMNGDITIDDAWNISENTANRGAALFITNGQFTMNGGTMVNNIAELQGGGIWASGATTTIEINSGAVIGHLSDDAYGNRAAVSGGGIFAQSGVTIEMNGGTISYNRVDGNAPGIGAGGGIAIISGPNREDGVTTVNMRNDATISNHTTNRVGGGVYLHSGILNMDASLNNYEGAGIVNNHAIDTVGGGIFNTDELNIHGGVIRGNTAMNGGGIYNTFGEESELVGIVTMTGGAIESNLATNSGGGVHMSDGTFTMSGTAAIIGNYATATDYGGGGVILYGEDAIFTMNSGTIGTIEQPNRGRYGGGVRVAAGIFNMSGGTIAGNIATNVEAETIPNGNGGGVFITDGIFNLGGMTVTASVIDENRGLDGGGIYLEGGTLNIIGTNTKNIINNTATRGAGEGSFGGGGGINWVGGTLNSSANNGEVNIIDNTSGRNGGGISMTADGTLTITSDWTIQDNYAYSMDTIHSGGGGIFVAGANSIINMIGGEIIGNTARRFGGGVHVGEGATFTMYDGLINGNTSSIVFANGGGGVGVISEGTFIMHGGTISENSARTGAGLEIHGADTVSYMTGGVIEHNNAFVIGTGTGIGGGVSLYGGARFEMSGEAIIQYNIARNNGGGIQVTNSEFIMHNGQILRNRSDGSLPDSSTTSSFQGGGVSLSNNGTFTMYNGIIEGNVAQGRSDAFSGFGGGVRVSSGSTFVMYDGRIINNVASGLGGGVRIDGNNSTFTMYDGEIDGNTAYGAVTATEINRGGGGVFVAYAGQFTAHAGSITNNAAPNGDGGGIFTERHHYSYILRADAYNNVSLTTAVTFEGNTARELFTEGPGNPEVISGWIPVATQRSSGTGDHVLNNYDINYRLITSAFEFIKVSANYSIRLPNAIFRIYLRVDDVCDRSEALFTNISDGDGLVELDGLIAGRQYCLVEFEAPHGYLTPLATQYWIITVQADGTIDRPIAQGGAPVFIDGNQLAGNDDNLDLLPNRRNYIPITGLTSNTTFYLIAILIVTSTTLLVRLFRQWDKNRQYDYVD